jgi:hypothetical protein
MLYVYTLSETGTQNPWINALVGSGFRESGYVRARFAASCMPMNIWQKSSRPYRAYDEQIGIVQID